MKISIKITFLRIYVFLNRDIYALLLANGMGCNVNMQDKAECAKQI